MKTLRARFKKTEVSQATEMPAVSQLQTPVPQDLREDPLGLCTIALCRSSHHFGYFLMAKPLPGFLPATGSRLPSYPLAASPVPLCCPLLPSSPHCLLLKLSSRHPFAQAVPSIWPFPVLLPIKSSPPFTIWLQEHFFWKISTPSYSDHLLFWGLTFSGILISCC